MTFESVIGLEIHAQLNTQSKLFCPASASFGCEPNKNVSPVSLGLPGALPVLNEQAVRYAIMAGIALNSRIQRRSVFARKNYFYADLPKGYQISQFDHPICLGGHVRLYDRDKTIAITRIHMEEDAGKLTHHGAQGIAGASGSVVDLNRAGVPLIEIVSEPDIRNASDARSYMETIHQILTFIGVCDGDLEKGSFRCDANVSIRPTGDTSFGTRTEIKNLNSFRSVERAIDFEIRRQIHVVTSGGQIKQQTMTFDDASGETSPLRSKENAHDYRYFPDPDLTPLIITDDVLNEIQSTMPDVPDVVRDTLRKEGLPEHDINVYVQSRPLFDAFQTAKQTIKTATPMDVSKWMVGDVNAQTKHQPTILTDAIISGICVLVDQCSQGILSTKMVKDCLPHVLAGESVDAVLARMGGTQISDQTELCKVVSDVLLDHTDVVAKIKNGKLGSVNFLMGQVMKVTKGRANPDVIRQLILDACHAP